MADAERSDSDDGSRSSCGGGCAKDKFLFRRRRRRRTFAWESSSPSPQLPKRSREEVNQACDSATESDDGVSSDASSSPRSSPRCHRRNGLDQTLLVIHSTVGNEDNYQELREKTAAATASRQLEDRPMPPPLGRCTVERRRARLAALTHDTTKSAAPRKTDAVADTNMASSQDRGAATWPTVALREVAAQLRGRGFAVVDGFRGHVAALQLRAGLEALSMEAGTMGAATRVAALRGDLIAWPPWKGSSAVAAMVGAWLLALDELIAGLRSVLDRPGELGSVKTREAPMASCYPPGAYYIRHYDNNCEGGSGDCNGRRLTAVYYFNEDLSDADGGHLRVVSQRGRAYDVLPSIDVLVLFWADRRTPHEVLPNAGRPRYALSCWYLDADEAPDNPKASPMHTFE
eukprot:TRINITY_DN37217_c0_g1_i1.p1 TRINITY_DN37217_c0_g1~~TRINITY_DN37217_c0_g1_i1.p1  ORF type:complete len:419 (-),score=70.03 TRINITY_DN37217_c0_g1_i1:21-1229(-)